jgi:predicted helicase
MKDKLMPLDHREQLKSIRKFPSLIKYLRDEMDWPLESDSFEGISFKFTPEELGIDSKNAANIQEIRRLRPLSPNQPWGIFFIKFEPKRLPVVALRRILNQVTLKKRASSNSADRKAWEAEDLLFVSNYGEGEDRQITLAHFHQNPEKKDLPVLKVLGWDDKDTALRLDDVADKLTNKLSWPEDEDDQDAWRKQWGEAFTLGHREVITTSKTLAVELAKLAQKIRNRIRIVLEVENDQGPLTKLMGTFKEALIDDLDEDAFADMYAQTISYGLLSARIATRGEGTSDDLASAMPVTNPFLKELMETFLDVGGRKASSGPRLDFDELGISEIIDLLDAANMEAVVADFGDKKPEEDPVIHFFEGFLQEYDNQIKKARGVFYTPRPVVSFIVRSVDELLRTEFGLEDGLADTTTWGEMADRIDDREIPEGATPDQAFVQILDPATGTGTFLVEVIDLIYKTMIEKWQAEGHGKKKIDKLWNDYVPEHLLPRLHGYELMMAPYAIAHMKIGLKLYETGYRFESDERARVYLTNALEPAQDFSGTLAFAIPALAHEAESVNAIKRDQRFTVVIGNPPYSIISSNQGGWIVEKCEIYKETARQRERQIQALSDDYVKFIRLAHWILEESSHGVIGMITNNGYLDGHLFADMRRCLIDSFPLIQVTNLHGNLRTRERAPDGQIDSNVFDIQTGVSTLFLAQPAERRTARFSYADVWGDRERKYAQLSNKSLDETSVELRKTNEDIWIPTDESKALEWGNYFSLTDVFGTGDQSRDAQKRYAAGFVSQQDEFAIAFSREEIAVRVKLLLAAETTEKELRGKFRLCTTSQWGFDRAREELGGENFDSLLTDCTYRPFDTRWTAFHRGVVTILRKELMRHMFRQENYALLATRGISRQDYAHIFVVDNIVDRHALDNASESMFVFPLFIFPDSSVEESQKELFGGDQSELNISPVFLGQILSLLEGRQLVPTDIFGLIYAVLHSPAYRSRYAGFLLNEFPRVGVPRELSTFRALAAYGVELLALHTLKSVKPRGAMEGSGPAEVEKVSYSDETVWIDKAKTRGFKGVPEEVWNFHIGGYQVCQKWLKDRQAKGGKNPRPGRVLTDEDIEHYQKIVVALSETIRIMAEIDEVIEAHGGWPNAFQTGEDEEASTSEDTDDTGASMAAEEGSLYGEDE